MKWLQDETCEFYGHCFRTVRFAVVFCPSLVLPITVDFVFQIDLGLAVASTTVLWEIWLIGRGHLQWREIMQFYVDCLQMDHTNVNLRKFSLTNVVGFWMNK